MNQKVLQSKSIKQWRRIHKSFNTPPNTYCKWTDVYLNAFKILVVDCANTKHAPVPFVCHYHLLHPQLSHTQVFGRSAMPAKSTRLANSLIIEVSTSIFFKSASTKVIRLIFCLKSSISRLIPHWLRSRCSNLINHDGGIASGFFFFLNIFTPVWLAVSAVVPLWLLAT